MLCVKPTLVADGIRSKISSNGLFSFESFWISFIHQAISFFPLIHINLASFICDIGKHCRPGSDTA